MRLGTSLLVGSKQYFVRCSCNVNYNLLVWNSDQITDYQEEVGHKSRRTSNCKYTKYIFPQMLMNQIGSKEDKCFSTAGPTDCSSLPATVSYSQVLYNCHRDASQLSPRAKASADHWKHSFHENTVR